MSTRFGGRIRQVAALTTIVATTFALTSERILYAAPPAATPFAASVARAAIEAAQAPAAAPDAPARPKASRAEKIAWAYLLVGGCVFIATSPGEKNGDGSWSRDGKAEMAAGIAAVGLSFALLRDILR